MAGLSILPILVRRPWVEPVLINSHISPMSLYVTLFYNRKNKVIWLDDCDSIYSNLAVLGILRSALWGQGERIVTYTSSALKDLPNRFVFDSRIIFCANQIPARNTAFKAVLSRVDCFRLEATNEEVIEVMRKLADRGYESLSPAECNEIVNFIEGYGSSRQLSMRLYEPSLKKMIYASQENVAWQDLVQSQLEQISTNDHVQKPINSKAYALSVMAQALERYPSAKDQEKFFCQLTGMSRASFFRMRKDSIEKRNGVLSNGSVVK